MLTGTTDVMATGLREQGYVEAMTAAGLRPAPPVPAGWDIDKGHAAAMHALTSGDPRPSALFCVNDRAAIGAVLAAVQLGLSVPGDLSVVGYDDDENVAPFLVPALTTVRLPHREMGERAMRVVLAAALDRSDPVLRAQPASAPPIRSGCPLVGGTPSLHPAEHLSGLRRDGQVSGDEDHVRSTIGGAELIGRRPASPTPAPPALGDRRCRTSGCRVPARRRPLRPAPCSRAQIIGCTTSSWT